MHTNLTRYVRAWMVWATLALALALTLSACGDVDANSTAASAPIRPSPTPTVAAAPATTAAPASNTTAAAGATTAASGGGTASGDAAAGLALFTSAKPLACSQCHLQNGKAAGGPGPILAGTTRDDAYIKNQLKNGKGAMPAFPNLTDAQQNDLIAYIRSLK